jgi:hypothetical protein
MLLDSRSNANSVWTDFVAYAFRDPVDVGRLEAAWRAVIAEIPALRSTIEWKRGAQARAKVHTMVPFALRTVDCSMFAPVDYEERLLAEEWTALGRRFVLERGPLFEVTVLHGPSGRADLYFTYHHVILDGQSARLVLGAVMDVYEGRAVRTPPSTGRRLPSKIELGRAATFAQGLRDYRHPDDPEPTASTSVGDGGWRAFHWALGLRAALAGWSMNARFRSSRDLRRAHDDAGLAPTSYSGGNVADYPLSSLHERALRAWAAKAGATQDAVWATTYALHLARERRTDDVLFGVVVSGRTPANNAGIGMLANCLPLRVRIDPKERVDELAARVGASLRELEGIARTPLLDLAREARLDPRAFLETLFVSWRFASAPTGARLLGGRSLTLCNTRLCLIVAPVGATTHLGLASRQFHRAHKARTQLVGLSDALVASSSELRVASLLDLPLAHGALTFRVEDVP